MKMEGFTELLADINRRIIQEEFKATFDSPKLDEGDASRILNDHPVSKQLSKAMMRELPQDIFQPPFLDPEAYEDTTHPNHEEAVERYEQINKSLRPYFDKMTFIISLDFLNTDRTELNASIQSALATNYKELKIDKEKLIVGLYSSIFAIYSQAIADVQSKKSAMKIGTHGPQRKMTDEAIAYTQHFSMIQRIINEYQANISLAYIKNAVPATEMLMTLGEECIAKGKITQAIECYKLAHAEDPQKLPDVGDEILNRSIERLSEISVEDSFFASSTSYGQLNLLLRDIVISKTTYESEKSEENFNQMMMKIDQCIESLEKTCAPQKTLWEEKVRPVLRALLAGVILIVLGAGSLGYAPIYLAMHPKERKIVVDSFFNQNKVFKQRLSDFKQHISAVKEISKTSEESVEENNKLLH